MTHFFRMLSAVGHIAENNEQYVFAKEHFSGERLEKLLRSRKRLIIFQASPWIIFFVAFIAVFIFVPPEEVPNGYASLRETILLFGSVFYVFFYLAWLILSQFVIGRLWQKYAKWYKKDGQANQKMNEIIDKVMPD